MATNRMPGELLGEILERAGVLKAWREMRPSEQLALAEAERDFRERDDVLSDLRGELAELKEQVEGFEKKEQAAAHRGLVVAQRGLEPAPDDTSATVRAYCGDVEIDRAVAGSFVWTSADPSTLKVALTIEGAPSDLPVVLRDELQASGVEVTYAPLPAAPQPQATRSKSNRGLRAVR